jgi:TPR repeat protein
VRLAERYETGDGVPFDLNAASALLELAAERGDAVAQYRLGLLQAGGLAPQADLAEAYGWLRLAAQSTEDAPTGLLAVAIGEALAERLDDAAIERAEQRVASFRPARQPLMPPASVTERRRRHRAARTR